MRLLKVWSGLPLWVFTAICAVFRTASVSLRSAVHCWVQLGVGSLFIGLQSSRDRDVSVLLRQRGAAPLAPYAADTPRGPMVVPVHAPSSPFGFTASPHGLELGEGNYIGSLGSMPDRAAPSRVVVVEAATVVVKQLPPLVTVCLADGNACRGIPAALTSGQVHIHTLTGAWLQDLHPIRAE